MVDTGTARRIDGKLLRVGGKAVRDNACCCKAWEIRSCPYGDHIIWYTDTDLSAHNGDVIRFTGSGLGDAERCGIVMWLLTHRSDGPVVVKQNYGGDCGACQADL